MSRYDGWGYDPFRGYDAWKTASPYDYDEGLFEDEVHDGLVDAFDEFNTGRWDWDRIDCCLTGKDADLEPWGDQGIEISDIDGEDIGITVHGLKTEAGTDVCLNTPAWFDDALYEKALDAYLEAAQECIMGCNSAGEWDGDSWILTFEEGFSVGLVYDYDQTDGEQTPDYRKTVEVIIEKANEVIQPWEDEMRLLSNLCNQLAGWRDGDNNPIRAGDRPEFSAWAHLNLDCWQNRVFCWLDRHIERLSAGLHEYLPAR